MKALFIFQLLLGLALIFAAIAAEAVPYALLDVVLTPSELQDEAKRGATLAILKKGAGFGPSALMVGGATVFITAAVGLGLMKRRRQIG